MLDMVSPFFDVPDVSLMTHVVMNQDTITEHGI